MSGTTPIYDCLRTYHVDNKKRYGNEGDGGYVIADMDIVYDCYISAGIGDEESFSRDFLKKHNYIGKQHSYAFDASMEDYPWEYTKDIQFIKKYIRFFDGGGNTNLKKTIHNYNNIFLSMDIEGYEYEWLLSLEESELKRFKQIVIEIHGTDCDNCSNCPEWMDDFHYSGAKIPLQDKITALKKLSETHYLIHAHPNNCGGGSMVNGVFVPRVIELTYIAKEVCNSPLKFNKIRFP